MIKLEIVFEDFIGVVIQPTEDGFIITYGDDDYHIKNGETLSLKSGDLDFKAYTEKEEDSDHVKLPDDSFVVKARVVDIEDMEPFKVHRDKEGEK